MNSLATSYQVFNPRFLWANPHQGAGHHVRNVAHGKSSQVVSTFKQVLLGGVFGWALPSAMQVCHYFLNQVSFLHLILMMYVFICFPCPTAFSFLCSHIFQQWEVQSQRSTDPESPLTLQNACYCTCKDENQFSGLMTFFVLGLSSGHFRRNVHLPATLDKWVSPSFHWFWVDAGKKSLSWLDLAIHPLVTWQFRWRWRLIYIYLLHPGHPRVCTKTSQIARMLDVFSWAWEMDDMQTCICSQLRLEQCRTIQRDQFLLPFYLWSLGSRRRCSVDFCRGHFLANENNIMQQ